MAMKTRSVTRSIQPVVKITPLDNQTSDFVYWQSQSFHDRISALEQIRAEIITER